MIDESTKTMLEERIGFGSKGSISLDIDDNYTDGESSRDLPYFHKLATLSNLYDCTEQVDMDKTNFQSFLANLRTNAVNASLTLVLYQSKDYKEQDDYSEVVTEKVALFDEVIGYILAINVIELLISSPRINDTKRKANQSYLELKMELEGVKNDGGAVISQGLQRKLNLAVKKAKRKIFPNILTVGSKKIW